MWAGPLYRAMEDVVSILAKLSEKFRGLGFEGSRFRFQGDAQRDEMDAPERGHSVFCWRKEEYFGGSLWIFLPRAPGFAKF